MTIGSKQIQALIIFLAITTIAPANGKAESTVNPDRAGDRIENRLDRRGDRADRRLDRRAAVARESGRDVLSNKLDRKGDRIDHRLDRHGNRINRRLDR